MRENLTKCSDSTCKMGKNFSQPQMSFSQSRHRNESNQHQKLYPNRYSLKKIIPRMFLLTLCYFKQIEALFFPKFVPLYFPEKVRDMDGIPVFKLLLLSSKDPSHFVLCIGWKHISIAPALFLHGSAIGRMSRSLEIWEIFLRPMSMLPQ